MPPAAVYYERPADPTDDGQSSPTSQQSASNHHHHHHHHHQQQQQQQLQQAATYHQQPAVLVASNPCNNYQQEQPYHQQPCLHLCTTSNSPSGANGGGSNSFQSVVSSSSLNSYDSTTSNTETIASGKHAQGSDNYQQHHHSNTITINNNNNNNHNNNNHIYYQLSPGSTLANGQQQQVTATSHSSLDSASLSNNSSSLMPINVKGMLLHGIQDDEIMQNWLASIKCQQYLRNFICHGYDMSLITRMTPQDLTSIGCKSPLVRRKLLTEIKRLNLDDGIPETRAETLEKWLALLKLGEYHARLCQEGYDTIDKVCQLVWEDLEEIGIVKLGHQKRLLIGIERLKKHEQMLQDRLAAANEAHQFEVHPNHRVSLAPTGDRLLSNTLGNRRSLRMGFFKNRSNASNRDSRGQPIATVMPAFKHINSFHQDTVQATTTTTTIISKSHQDTASKQAEISQSLGANNGGAMLRSNSRLRLDGVSSSRHCSPSRPTSQSFGVELVERTSDQSMGSIKRYAPPPLPPARTNSLKIPHHHQTLDTSNNNSNTSSLYGETAYTTANQNIYSSLPAQQVAAVSSTSFLRTPRLGTLTATTNKMLSSGGHLQTLAVQQQQQTNMRSMQPVREAPPVPNGQVGAGASNGLTVTSQADQSCDLTTTITTTTFGQSPNSITNDNLTNTSLIEHQLASADEFPPPPPPPPPR